MKLLGILGIIFGSLWLITHFPHAETPREYPALCIDPQTSQDLNTTAYTWCKLVPKKEWAA